MARKILFLPKGRQVLAPIEFLAVSPGHLIQEELLSYRYGVHFGIIEKLNYIKNAAKTMFINIITPLAPRKIRCGLQLAHKSVLHNGQTKSSCRV